MRKKSSKGVGFYLGLTLLILVVLSYVPLPFVRISSSLYNLVSISAGIFLMIRE